MPECLHLLSLSCAAKVSPSALCKPGFRETLNFSARREPGWEATFAPGGPGPDPDAGIQTRVPCIPGAWTKGMRVTNQPASDLFLSPPFLFHITFKFNKHVLTLKTPIYCLNSILITLRLFRVELL